MSHPDSETTSLVDAVRSNIRLPNYQRDFAWDNPKMNQLWDDLLTHVLKRTQLDEESQQYFLGAVVVDRHDGVKYLVDGQQRFTTMYLISCALRDALISTGYTSLGHGLHHNIIIDTNKINDEEERNRYELLDIPEDDPRSSEYQLSPYRKRLVNIPTGLIIGKGGREDIGSNEVSIKGGKIKWTVESGEKWFFRLWDQKKSSFVGKVYQVSEDDENFLKEGGNTPRKIILSSDSAKFSKLDEIDVFREGLEIILNTNIFWAGKDGWIDTGLHNRAPLDILDDAERKRDMNKDEACDLFHPRNREFYFYVRNTAEHFIRGYKTFTPAAGIRKGEKSTTLYLKRGGPEGMIAQSSRNPKKGEELIFIERNESASWPSVDQICDLIEEDESSFLEFKQGFRIKRFNPNNGKHEYTKMMIEMSVKAVASFLNSRGGILLVGVRDGGKVVGINDEDYIDKKTGKWSDDKAIMFFADQIRRYIGRSASKFVDYKVYNIDHEKVMCVKVEKYPGNIEVEISTRWNSDTGERLSPAKKEYFTKDAVSSLKMSDEEAVEYRNVARYLSSALGDEYKGGNSAEIEHVFEVSEFSGIPEWTRSTSIQTKYPSVKGRVVSENDIPAHSECSIPYLEPGKEWHSWLDTEEKRAGELKALVEKTCFSRILFENNPAAAITHFMLANDATRFEPLNAYDLVSSFTEKLVDTSQGQVLTNPQKKIKSKWKRLRTKLYIDSDKDEKKINDFFGEFLLSTLRTKTGTRRFTAKETWEGINREFKSRTYDSGLYDYGKMAELYTDMEEHMVTYLRAVNDNSEFWNERPYSGASCRDERTLLQTIYLTGSKQHIAAYIALVRRVEDQSADRGVIKEFLKNFNYVWLRFMTLPRLMQSEYGTGFTGQQVYSKQIGPNGWITRIDMADMNSDEDRKAIASMPLELIPESENLDEDFPWSEDHPSWKSINIDGTKATTHIKHLLYSVERALEPDEESNQNPQMSRVHGHGVKVQVEHIIPQSPRLLGGKWYSDGETTGYHKKYIFALGNHCLIEDSKNSSVRNKIPSDKAKVYLGSDFKLAKIVGQEIIDSGTWDKSEIMRNSTRIMNSLVRFYS